MALEAPAKKQRTACTTSEDSTTTTAKLQARIKQLEAERDTWKQRAGNIPETQFPATHWPATKPSYQPVEYPTYDLSKSKESFLEICDFMIEDILKELPAYEMPPQEVAWCRKMLDFNVRGGKMNRGLMVVESGVTLLQSLGRPATNETVVKLAILGWCIEWLQAWLLMADDFMDDSKTRRGRPCWYLRDDVKKIALNDAFMVEMFVFKTLKRHFVNEPYYHQLVDLFLETTFQTELGQLADTLCMNMNIQDFTVDRWTLIVKYKTAFYSFYMSVALGMIVAGITDVAEYNACRDILLTMGVYFQAQDDYLDCFGTPEQIGKIGTDIQDKKCGWLFVHAYQHLATPEQKQVFHALYGRCKVQTPEEQTIRDLYAKLGLKEMYEQYEQDSYAKIMSLKNSVKVVPWSVFEAFLQKIYKRQK